MGLYEGRDLSALLTAISPALYRASPRVGPQMLKELPVTSDKLNVWTNSSQHHRAGNKYREHYFRAVLGRPVN